VDWPHLALKLSFKTRFLRKDITDEKTSKKT